MQQDLFKNIPQLLKDLNIWLCYDDRQKDLSSDLMNQYSKQPRDLMGKPHSINGRLFSFNECIDSIKKGYNSGLGIVLKNTGVVCVDYDNCIDYYKKDNKLGLEIPILKAERQEQITRDINLLNSYTEISPSGKGIHIYLVANNNIKVNINKNDIEIYTNKFIRVSGKLFNDFMFNDMEDKTTELEQLLDIYLIEKNDNIESKKSVFYKKNNIYNDLITNKFKYQNKYNLKDIKEIMFKSKKGALIEKLYYNTITDDEFYILKNADSKKSKIDISNSGKSITLILYLLHFCYGDLKAVYNLFIKSGLCKEKYLLKRYSNGTENIIQHCFIPYAIINYYNFNE